LRNKLGAALLLAALSTIASLSIPAAAESVDLFPRPNEIFPLLILYLIIWIWVPSPQSTR